MACQVTCLRNSRSNENTKNQAGLQVRCAPGVANESPETFSPRNKSAYTANSCQKSCKLSFGTFKRPYSQAWVITLNLVRSCSELLGMFPLTLVVFRVLTVPSDESMMPVAEEPSSSARERASHKRSALTSPSSVCWSLPSKYSGWGPLRRAVRGGEPRTHDANPNGKNEETYEASHRFSARSLLPDVFFPRVRGLPSPDQLRESHLVRDPAFRQCRK